MGVKTGELNTSQFYLVSTVSNDRVGSILVCSREYRVSQRNSQRSRRQKVYSERVIRLGASIWHRFALL
jgi:hypothetical protein